MAVFFGGGLSIRDEEISEKDFAMFRLVSKNAKKKHNIYKNKFICLYYVNTYLFGIM